MAQVRITSQLQAQLTGTPLTPELLMKRFSDWKDGDEYGSYWFGRDSRDPNTGLSHVHMVPLTDQAALATWDLFWGKKSQRHRRRSDCYVMYAYDRLYGYLLIALLVDPGAHDLWTPAHRQQRESYEIVADNFIFAGVIP